MSEPGKLARSVVVLGASTNPLRYSNMAMKKLLEHGYDVIPVHPHHTEVEGIGVCSTLGEVEGPVDTVTVYVSDAHRNEYLAELLELNPRRVLFNPGSESEAAKDACVQQGILVEEACTLVLLSIHQF